MKRSGIILTLVLFVNWCVPVAALGTQPNEISMGEAFKPVQAHFTNNEALFYLIEEEANSVNDNSFWQFFVDLAPGYGWEHDCCIVEVPRITSDTVAISNIINRRFPPNSKLIPLHEKSSFLKVIEPTKLMTQACVDKRVLSSSDSLKARQTCAIILSGGLNPNANYVRYWNDCSFLYQTLVNRYGIPKNNIHVAISDGTSNNIDMNLESSDNAICSSPLDLDFDGQPDTRYAATKSGLNQAISNISSRHNIEPFKHFFLFVIDHGGHDDKGSYICLWNVNNDNDDYRLYSSDLLQLLEQFITGADIFKSAVMAQCYSGGFIEPLRDAGFVIATATKENELSSPMNGHKFDHFAYNWTCGMNGKDELKHTVYADSDGDGHVSMKEAFNFAAARYTGGTEHPQYASVPPQLGERLSFHNLPVLEPDLYIRDNYNDNGMEPNNYERFWDSPDIWLGNDSTKALSDSYWPDSIAYVSVKIHNKGIGPYIGGRWLNIYWSISSPTLSANDWKGEQGGIGGKVWGGMIQKRIEAGDSVTLTIPWKLKEDAKRNLKDNGNINLLAFIGNSPYSEIDDSYDVKNSKNLAQKNYSRYSLHRQSHSDTIKITNLSDSQRWFTIEPVNYPHSMGLFDLNLEMSLSSPLYYGWRAGGSKYSNCSLKNNTFIISKTNAVIDSIRIPSYKKGEIMLSLSSGPNYNPNKYAPSSIKCDFVAKADGKVIGGITYKINPMRVSIKSEALGNDIYMLSTDLNESDYEYIRWLDSNGNDLGHGESIVVTLENDAQEFSVEAKHNDGFIDKDKLLLKLRPEIENFILNTDKSWLEVKFDSPLQSDALINVVPLTNFNIGQLNNTVARGELDFGIDISVLPSGWYAVSYFINGELIETFKFVK
ncbi:MAG: hypothetical protein J6B03_08500 [Candidatus Homeothermus sp.]|nr:hypothetical protein [Candidatus Homeothermus sp.]